TNPYLRCAVSYRNDHRHARIAFSHGRHCGACIARIDHFQSVLSVQRSDEPLRARAAVFIDHGDSHSGGRRPPRSKDAGEDREEDDRHDEAQHPRRAIASQIHPAAADDVADHSRKSLPVKCKKTLSSDGTFSTMTISRLSPTVERTSSSLVPWAMILPWSMMAMRSHSRSAFSM